MSTSTHRLLDEGLRLHQTGRLRQAEKCYLRLLKKQPDNPDANNLLGLLCLQSGRHALAVKRIRAALTIRPNDARARFNLGLAYIELGQYENAQPQFEKSVALDPANADAQNALANTLRLSGNLEDACRIFETALTLQPAHPGFLANFSRALNELGVHHNGAGDTELAIHCFRRAVAADSRNAEAQLNLGITLEQVGQLDAAAGPLEAAIDGNPRLWQAYYQLAHLRGYSIADEQIDSMREQLQEATIGKQDRALLLYALGEALDRNGDHANAFECFIAANDLQKAANRFDRCAVEHLYADLERVFNEAFLASFSSAGTADETPIFIVGMPRSGTTLVEQILASHSRVCGAGEVDCLPDAINVTFGGPGHWMQNVAASSADDVRRFGTGYVAGLRQYSADAARVTDKAPMNFKYIGLIAAALPRAKIVHCTRNPLDTCVSIFSHPLADVHAYAHDLQDLGIYYRLYVRLMHYWTELLPGKIHTVCYEKLIGNTEKEVRRLLAHCELDFESQCLEFYATNRAVRTPSAGQVRQPIYATSIERWRCYEEYLEPLREALLGEE